MVCSFRLVRSAYPLVVLAVNLTATEHDALRAIGVDDVIDVTPHAQQLAALLRARTQPRDCRMTGSGSWIIWSRHDFDSTMYKALLWSRLAGRYDEVAFLDVDIMFRSKPDRLFEALAPNNNSSRSGARHRGWQWWRWSKKKWKSGCGKDIPHTAPLRPLCDRLDFVAMKSGRLDMTNRWFHQVNRSECKVNGWQTGFFMTRPTPRIGDALVARALNGNFSYFTSTEQDVIDAEFDSSEACEWSPPSSAAESLQSAPPPPCVRHARMDVGFTYINHHKMHAFDLDSWEVRELSTRSALDKIRVNRALANLSNILCSHARETAKRRVMQSNAQRSGGLSSDGLNVVAKDLMDQVTAMVERASREAGANRHI